LNARLRKLDVVWSEREIVAVLPERRSEVDIDGEENERNEVF
jgi:hypothetical protein